MSAKKKTANKVAAKKTASKVPAKKAAKSTLKKGDIVAFDKWAGKPPEDSEEIKKGMIGKVRTVSDDEVEVAMEIDGETVLVPFSHGEVLLATKKQIDAAQADEDEEEEAAEEEEEEAEDESEEEEAEPTPGELADEGDKKAIKQVKALCEENEIDENDYETWAEAYDAALEASGGEESEEEAEEEEAEEAEEEEAEEAEEEEAEEAEEAEEEEDSEGALADGGNKASVKLLTKQAKAAGIDPDDYESWVDVEAAIAEASEEEDDDEEEEEEDAVVEDGTKKKVDAKKAAKEPSLGRLADGGDKPATRELTKRCRAMDIDPDDYETWAACEKDLKAAEKEASRPELKITAAVQEEIGEDGSDAVAAAKRLMETAERSYFTLGGVLAYMQRNKTYEKIKVKGEYPYQGKDGFEALCEEKIGMGYRKAVYFIRIYEAFTSAGLTEKKIASIGWSKAKELVNILQAEPDAADKWIEIAKNSSTGKLQESVKARLTKIGAKVHGKTGATARTVRCMFSVHQDEGKVVEKALALAKEQADTESDSEAFAYIMKEWLGYQS